uniref:Large ribosomal subunit protein mL43 n=1 Tax=Theropithecus gelada TaxID=9565 RepID=A0A8D2FQ20_THEGE
MDLCQAGRAVRRIRERLKPLFRASRGRGCWSPGRTKKHRLGFSFRANNLAASQDRRSSPNQNTIRRNCSRLRGLQAVAMTARGTPSRFLASVLHNGLGRYVQQLQRLSFSVSRDGASSRGAREFVEREVIDFARRNPGVVIYVNSRPCCVPRVVAEYLNGSVREESIHCKSVEEISTLVQKLANQSGLDVIRIRKPFHTDNPSIQGQWHPFTNKPTTFRELCPREVQDPAPAQVQAQ